MRTPGSSRRLRDRSPQGIAGEVYGTIVVMGALAAGAHGGPIRSRELAGIVAGTAIVLWIAHVYAHSLAETISRGRRLDRAEVLSVATRELAMLLAAVPPVGALMLGAAGILKDSTAGWLAMGFGLATLAVAGVQYATVERLGFLASALTILVNIALGLVIVGLKAGLGH
ncbi:MAG: hypothetical protein ACJ750_09685 [Gaiellaceae bacterium]